MAAADFTLGRRPPFRGSAETLVAVLIIWNYPIVQSITGIPCPIPLVLFPREVLRSVAEGRGNFNGFFDSHISPLFGEVVEQGGIGQNSQNSRDQGFDNLLSQNPS